MTEEEIKKSKELFASFLSVCNNGDYKSAIEIDEQMENEFPLSGLTYLASAWLNASFYFRSAENPIDYDALESNLSYFESLPEGWFEDDFVNNGGVASMDDVAYIMYVHHDEKLLALNNQNATALGDAVKFSEFNLERASALLNDAEKNEHSKLIAEISARTQRLKNLNERMDAAKQRLCLLKEHITELNVQKKNGQFEADIKKTRTTRIIRFVLGAVMVVVALIILIAKR